MTQQHSIKLCTATCAHRSKVLQGLCNQLLAVMALPFLWKGGSSGYSSAKLVFVEELRTWQLPGRQGG